jgi:peroxiredoxin Q/BCP
MTTLGVGDPAPGFELIADDGRPFSLAAQRGRTVVLFFYPEDGTEGCTIENLEFSHLMPKFSKLGVVVAGISPDSFERHCAFRDKYRLRAPLLADPGHRVTQAFGLWGPKKTFGVSYMGVYRTTVLIGPDGRIAEIWPVKRIKGHAEAVLATVKTRLAARG